MNAGTAKRYAETKNADLERVRAARQAIIDHVEGRGGYAAGSQNYVCTYLAVAAVLNGSVDGAK